MANEFLHPVKIYKELEAKFYHILLASFERLTQQSRIDIEANQKKVEQYKQLKGIETSFRAKRGRFNLLQLLLLIVFAINSVLLIFAFVGLINKVDINAPTRLAIQIPLSIVLMMIISLIGKKTKALNKIEKEFESKATAEQYEMYDQMAWLNSLFDTQITKEALEKTLPFLKLNDYFDDDQAAYLLAPADQVPDDSILEILSGKMYGNSMIFLKMMRMEMGIEVYTNTISVPRLSTYIDSNGKLQTETVYDYYTGRYSAPKPFYFDFVQLLYSHDAAPNLSFSRSGNRVHMKNEQSLRRYVERESKKLHKRQEDSVKLGQAFSLLDNIEFEVLFNALDRNNEVEFRALFSPLAQQNMRDVILHSPFGDDFIVRKECRHYSVFADHTTFWDMRVDVNKFRHFSYEEAKKNFIQFNMSYFQHFYSLLLPVLAIPLHHEPHVGQEYPEGVSPYRYSAFEKEMLANALDYSLVAHPETATNGILKIEECGASGKTEFFTVTCQTFATVERVAEVYDGPQKVPVPWIEYIPLSKTSLASCRVVNLPEPEFEALKAREEFRAIEANTIGEIVYKNNMVVRLIRQIDHSEEAIFQKLLRESQEVWYGEFT